jgi:hypothetical protein
MVWLLLILAIGFLAGVALRFARSPNPDPLAKLGLYGVDAIAQISAVEAQDNAPNVQIDYHVSGHDYRRTVPWPADRALPELGTQVPIRYLPDQPGLSRLRLS